MIYLYVKQHNITGLKYFGKTQKPDPYAYPGSGKYWKRHLKVHGKDVETIQVWSFTDIEECSRFAIQYSIDNNIVESDEWANLRIENGIDGGILGNKPTRETVMKAIKSRSGYRHSDDTKAKISAAKVGKILGPYSEQRKAIMKLSYTPQRSAKTSATRIAKGSFTLEEKAIYYNPERIAKTKATKLANTLSKEAKDH